MAISRNSVHKTPASPVHGERFYFTFVPLKNLSFVSAFLVIPRPILLIAADNGCLGSTLYDRSRNKEAAIVSARECRQSYRHSERDFYVGVELS